MSVITENIIAYFSKKENGEEITAAPAGMCPACWGHSEWDGHFYQKIKGKHLDAKNEIYKNFISKIVDAHTKTTHKNENKYICTTCDKQIA